MIRSTSSRFDKFHHIELKPSSSVRVACYQYPAALMLQWLVLLGPIEAPLG